MNTLSIEDDRRIPVTLLTGFLGAGKTTLLNHVVRQPEMERCALLINEFGEVGIDHHLVERVDETLMILDSGCLCCSVQGDLVKALRDLADRASKRQIPPVTRVLIETTGLADPAPVIYTLMQDPFVAARYRCDGVVTVVDATHAVRQVADHGEALRQIAMADRLLISKCDLADATSRRSLEATLAALNPGAGRIEVSHGKVDPAALFGGGIYTSVGKIPDVAAWLGEEGAGRIAPPATPTGTIQWKRPGTRPAAARRHDGTVTSFVIPFAEPVPWYGFAVTLGAILEKYGPRILRAKGLVNVAGDPLPRVIHCVEDVAYPPVNLRAWPGHGPFAEKQGRLVFIVRNLDPVAREAVRRLLADLPREHATPARISNCPLPTRCWLTHAMPAVSPPALQAEGWNVHVRRLVR